MAPWLRLMLALSLATGVVAAPIELENASFEAPDPDAPGQPAAWWPSFAVAAELAVDDAVAHTGQRSVRVRGLDPAAMDMHISAWRHGAATPPAGDYYLILFARGEDLTGPARLRVLLRDAAGETRAGPTYETPAGTFPWRRLVLPLSVPEWAAKMELVFGLQRTGGTVWFDDVSLMPAAEMVAELGEVAFEPAAPLTVASPGTLQVTYTVGAAGLAPGGGLRVDFADWRQSRPWGRADDPRVSCSRDGVTFAITRGERVRSWPPLLIGGLLTATHTAGPALVEGDRVTLAWDTLAPAVNTETADLHAAVDVDGGGVFLDIGSAPLALRHGPPTRLGLSATATPAPGEPARLTVAGFDEHGNGADGLTGEIELRVEGGACEGLPARITLGPDDRGTRRLIVRFPEPGIYRVVATGPGGLEGRSHPIWVRTGLDDQRIHFGDLHVHGAFSADAVGPPRYTHVFARDYLGLDFAALSDHAPGTDDWAPWAETKQVNNESRDVPWYDTIQGYERSFQRGHKNVYFPDDDPPYYGGNDTDALWARLDGREAVTVPHTPNTNSGVKNARGELVWSEMDWEPRNEQYQRVVELVQTRSSYEQDAKDPDLRVTQGGHGASVQDALAMGHTMGFIGSTDTHDGRPGSKQGWAALLAPRLERRALWQALFDRRCYATSGARILVDFRLNDAPMGSELRLPAGDTPRRIAAEVVGTDTIARIDLIRDGQLFSSAQPEGDHVRFEGFDDSPLTGRRYYYVRVIQTDTQMAWTSPVWVEVGR